MSAMKANLKIFKYGALLTAGGVAGAYFAGRAGADLGQGDIAGSTAAKTALAVGAGLTGAVMARRQVGKGLSYLGEKMSGPKIPGTSKGSVIFRRFKGRIIPIRTK